MSIMPKLPPEADRRAALKALIDKGIEPSPENLMKASRKRGAPLYSFFKGLSDQELAEYARYEICRKIIHVTKVDFSVGGATISVRQVECVRSNGEKRYAAIEEIMADKSLTKAYMAEVQSLLSQASGKLDRIQALMSE